MNSQNWEIGAKKQQKTCVAQNDLKQYLLSLPLPQRIQLKDIIDSHPNIQTGNRGSQRYYWSTDNILKQIQFLISQSKQKKVHELQSVGSNSLYIQQKIKSQRIYNLSINAENYREIINKITFLKKIDLRPFEMVLQQKKQNSLQKISEIYISSKCRGITKVFFIFQEFFQLIKLQTLLDIEWNLETINTIQAKFQEQKITMLKNSYNNYQLYFFQRLSPQSWDKFIANINKEPQFTFIILMKFALFPELLLNKSKFNSTIKLAFPEAQFNLSDFNVSQMKVSQPEVGFSEVEALALKIIAQNSREYSFQQFTLDPITGYNVISLHQKGVKEILVSRPDEDNKKIYIHFPFYNKFMEVIKEAERVVLVERNSKVEISSKVNRGSLEDMMKDAVLNQLSFFSFYQQVKEISKMQINCLKRIKIQDKNRLLYYQQKLNEKLLKASFPTDKDNKDFFDKMQPLFLFKFENEQIVSKMGKTKSQQIKKKYREGIKGCILARSSFVRSFISKCLEKQQKSQ